MLAKGNHLKAKGATPAPSGKVTKMQTLNLRMDAQGTLMSSNEQSARFTNKLKSKKVHEVGRKLASLHTAEGS